MKNDHLGTEKDESIVVSRKVVQKEDVDRGKT